MGIYTYIYVCVCMYNHACAHTHTIYGLRRIVFKEVVKPVQELCNYYTVIYLPENFVNKNKLNFEDCLRDKFGIFVR